MRDRKFKSTNSKRTTAVYKVLGSSGKFVGVHYIHNGQYKVVGGRFLTNYKRRNEDKIQGLVTLWDRTTKSMVSIYTNEIIQIRARHICYQIR